MTLEVLSIVAIALALPVTAMIGTAFYGPQVGNAGLLGNRDSLPAPSGAAGRAKRAHANLLENALPFLAVMLLVLQQGATNTLTATAAALFMAARLVHFVSYVAGIIVVRTIAFHLGTVAILMLVWALLR